MGQLKTWDDRLWTVDGGAREREDSVCGGWGHGAKDTWERERVCECGRGEVGDWGGNIDSRAAV